MTVAERRAPAAPRRDGRGRAGLEVVRRPRRGVRRVVPRRTGRHRPARPERRRQVDDAADAVRAHAPSRGSVRVLGRDPHRDLALARRIGLVPQQEALFESLTAFEFVRLAAMLQRLPDPAGAATRRSAWSSSIPATTVGSSTYSKGMRQRVKVAQAIVHDPEVIILDEPLTGLDPRQRLHLIDLFQRLGAANVRHRVEPRARRGRAVRLAGARDRAGPAGRRGRLPRHPRADGRPAAPHPRPQPTGRGRWPAGLLAQRGGRRACDSTATTRSSSTPIDVARFRRAIARRRPTPAPTSTRSRRSTTTSRASSATWWADDLHASTG